jgi:uncharacterized damage-inducible protein DinB
MSIADALIAEAAHEAGATRKVLERLPADKFGWQPHEKSMTLGRLASHVADNAEWGTQTMKTTELDFDPSNYKPWIAASTAELLAKFDKCLADFLAALRGKPDSEFMVPWTLKGNGQPFFTLPRVAVLRSMILNHTVHHRGQLTVYMRLLGIPVPAIYGPSADEQM